jgi:CRP-like cAMP-binding protein
VSDSRKSISVTELATYPLFRDLTREEIVTLLDSAKVRTCAGDHRLLFRQGDPADGMYLILAGEVDVFSFDTAMRKHLIGTLGEGEFFGEMSLLEEKGRAFGVEARDEARLIFLSKEAFVALQSANAAVLSKVFLRMLSVMSNRLRLLGQRYVSARAALGSMQGE